MRRVLVLSAAVLALGSFNGKYGLPIPFAFETAAAASYVRLVPERHRAHPYSQDEAPLKHPRAFLVDSAVVVDPA